VLLSIMI